MMNINFYLVGEEETHITTIYDAASNPFKLYDIVSLDVMTIVPKEYEQFFPEVQERFKRQNDELRQKFRFKKLRLVEENKYIKFSNLGDTKLEIEYHCQLFNDENLKQD